MGPRARFQQKLFSEQAKAKNDEMKKQDEEKRRMELHYRFPKKMSQLDFQPLNSEDVGLNDECITFWSQYAEK